MHGCPIGSHRLPRAIEALATPPATSMNQWPWLAEQSCRLPHKWHYEGRRDDVSKNLGHRNYQGIPTGNPWNPVVATPWPTETVLSRSLLPSLAESPCLVVINDEELPTARVVALARLGWSGYSEPTGFPSLHGEIACRPSGKGPELHSKYVIPKHVGCTPNFKLHDLLC